MQVVYQVYDTQNVIGELAVVSEFNQARDIADDFISLVYPNRDDIRWTQSDQCVVGKEVAVRIEALYVDDFSMYLMRRAEVERFLETRRSKSEKQHGNIDTKLMAAYIGYVNVRIANHEIPMAYFDWIVDKG